MDSFQWDDNSLTKSNGMTQTTNIKVNIEAINFKNNASIQKSLTVSKNSVNFEK